MSTTTNPGQSELYTANEPAILASGPHGFGLAIPRVMTIASDAVDPANTPATVIRAGMVLGIKTATGKAYPYDPTATDGTQVPVAILAENCSTIDYMHQANDQQVLAYVGAGVMGRKCHRLDQRARDILTEQGMIFDDSKVRGGPYVLAANTTLTPAQSGSYCICTTANVTVTLPALANGLRFKFARADNFNMVVASAAGNDMIVNGDAAASSVAFQTANKKIGGVFEVEAIYVGTNLRWLVSVPCQNTVTIV